MVFIPPFFVKVVVHIVCCSNCLLPGWQASHRYPIDWKTVTFHFKSGHLAHSRGRKLMKMERPNAKPLSPEELEDLEKLRVILERAIADGCVTEDEMNAIKACFSADGKVLFEEIELCQQLIWDKIDRGEIQHGW